MPIAAFPVGAVDPAGGEIYQPPEIAYPAFRLAESAKRNSAGLLEGSTNGGKEAVHIISHIRGFDPGPVDVTLFETPCFRPSMPGKALAV